VQLWQDDERTFGLFLNASGLTGDMPVGLLENVEFKPSAHTLLFNTRLSIGAIYMGRGKQEPGHDLFSFNGLLKGNGISGVLTHIDKLQPKSRPSIKRVLLEKTNHAPIVEAGSYDDWERNVEPILRTRGPKW
jgi:hypothetical protein